MPDQAEYLAGIRKKARVYAQNQIPALFVYPQDLRGRDWPARVVERIRDVYHARISPPGYRPARGRWYRCGGLGRARYGSQ